MKTIPYGRHSIDSNDINAVLEILNSDFLTQGPAVKIFENNIEQYCNVRSAIVVSNATNALYLSCLALGVGAGDYVWTTAITFVASANCALYCGAAIDFVDIDSRSFNISVDSLRNKLIDAKQKNKLPKVLVVVHFTGEPCLMAEIWNLSQEFGFKIIEDASHAIGAEYYGKKVGSSEMSDLTVFSFHPVKIITTAEGGAITTNSSELAEKLRLLRSHGITNDRSKMLIRPNHEVWNYQQISLGFNFRMNDVQAALGTSQLSKIEEFLRKRNAIADVYDARLEPLPLKLQCRNKDFKSSHHLYVVRFDYSRTEKKQKDIYSNLKKKGIEVNLHYIPVYRQPYFESLGFKVGYCPQAELYFHEAITLPIFPALTFDNQMHIISALEEALK